MDDSWKTDVGLRRFVLAFASDLHAEAALWQVNLTDYLVAPFDHFEHTFKAKYITSYFYNAVVQTTLKRWSENI